MADRHPSFFGPVLPQDPEAPEAFSAAELQRIRGRRIEADMQRMGPSAWPAERRFPTMLPRRPGPYPVPVDRVVSGVRVIVS